MVLDVLHAGVEVGGVELVRDVPAQRSELAPLLDRGVQERHCVQHRLPLRHVGDVEEVLRDVRVRPLQPSLDTLRGLHRELDGNLEGDSNLVGQLYEP